MRLNRTCGGYPDRWRLVHRQQDEIAAIRVQSRVTKRRAERNHQRAAEPRTSATSKSAAVCVSPAPAPLNVAVEVYYIPRFFSDYSANSGVAIYDALPVLASASPATCYSHALKAVAMASSSGLLCQSGLLTRARVSYGLALSNLQRAILDPEPLRDDSVLVTLFLLGFFEVRCHICTSFCLFWSRQTFESPSSTPLVPRISDPRRSSPRRFSTPGLRQSSSNATHTLEVHELCSSTGLETGWTRN